MTLQVAGNGELKITKITTTGTLTSSEQAPITLTTQIDPALKIGYTLNAVSIGGNITSCKAVTPDGTKDIVPTNGACNVTYTPGG